MAWLVALQEEGIAGRQCSLALGMGTSYFLPGWSAPRTSTPPSLLHLKILELLFLNRQTHDLLTF